MSQLYEKSIFMSIGHREFHISRDVFQGPGNTPNFFTLGFAIFFSSPEEVFPGLDREGLIRPPSIMPPAVDGRSADIFADILHLLKGYPVHIRDEDHRAALLRDCRYFNFKGLEQRIIPHNISYNQVRRRSEIVLRLEDILKSGISYAHDPAFAPAYGSDAANPTTICGWVNYARPYVDDSAYELILEIGGENTKIHINVMRAEFFGQIKARVTKLFEVIAAKLNLPPTTQPLGLLMAKGGAGSQAPSPGNTALSEDLVKIAIDSETYIELDGKVYPTHAVESDDSQNTQYPGDTSMGNGVNQPDSPSSGMGGGSGPSKKRRRLDVASTGPVGGKALLDDWVVKKGHWRLKIQGTQGGKTAVECVLVAVRLEAYSNEQARNAQRAFLV